MADAPRPTKIGRYDVERQLGQGGMGIVWLARDTVLGRLVAIKTLRDDLALPPKIKDELVERMRHEARAAAAVSHPNIVTLHDMGEDDALGIYLVFEYVPGPGRVTETEHGPESLRDRLKHGPLALTDVALLARQLGDALAYAHEQGVIHRDVKPENILFSRTGAKIADFGIARIPESTITRANTVLGTPAYTSPEALSKGDFGPRSDQFSLAATLYEAVSGARAFGAEDAIVTAGRVSNDPPPPLDPSLAGGGVVRALSAALEKGLAKEAPGRFESCAALGEAIARAIGPGGRTAAPEESVERIAVDTAQGRIEIERTPLSSRMALVERATRMTSDRPPPVAMPTETPARPSLYVRNKTQRVQNIVAAVALLVIVVLILMGKKADDPARDTTARSASAAPSSAAPPSAHPTSAKPRSRNSPSAGQPAFIESADAAASD